MNQISMFDGNQKFRIEKPFRLIELFAGYGSQSLALKYLGVKFEHWHICEWAVKSIQAYKDLHFSEDKTDYSKGLCKQQICEILFSMGISADYKEPMSYTQIKRLKEPACRKIYNNIKATHNLVSVCRAKGKDFNIIDTDKYNYGMTYSFPCQSISLSGKNNGMQEGSGTTSSMLWEVKRILSELYEIDGEKSLPQILLMENVPQVHGKNNKDDFYKWCDFLESIGYKNYWKDLNAKNFGVPQNRDRCFMVSILGDYYYDFPQEIPLRLRLKDLLEKNVDEKYYISDKTVEYYIHHTEESKERGNGFEFMPTDGENLARTVTTRAGGRMDDNFIKATDNSTPPRNSTADGCMLKQSKRFGKAPLEGLSRTILAENVGAGVVEWENNNG